MTMESGTAAPQCSSRHSVSSMSDNNGGAGGRGYTPRVRNVLASSRTVPSSHGLPTICKPSGRPLASKPDGTLITVSKGARGDRRATGLDVANIEAGVVERRLGLLQ